MSEHQNSTKTQRCSRCDALKVPVRFNRDRKRKSGRRSECRDCQKVYKARHYAANSETCRAYTARWQKENPARHRSAVRRWRAENPERVAAHGARRRAKWADRDRARRALNRAVARGEIERQPCEVCGLEPKVVNGRQRIEAHHHKGYEPEHWLDVEWLCCPHHREADAAQKEKKNGLLD